MRGFHQSILKTVTIIYGIPTITQYNECCLTVGNFCSIAQGCCIMLGGEHFVIRVSTYPFGKEADREFTNVGNDEIFPAKKDTMIGNDVWVGRNVTILSGVNIGDGAVIGAGAVVSKDIPPYAIAVGNPIRILRYRFNKDIIAALQMISWWDWSDEKINDMLPLIMSDEPEKLIFACLGQNWREKIVEK